MNKKLGAILIGVGAVLGFLAIVLPYGSMKLEFMGESMSESVGSLIGNKAVPPLFWVALVVAIAAVVVGFVKDAKIGGIMGAAAGAIMLIITFLNTTKQIAERGIDEYGGFMGLENMVKYSNGIGWICFLLSSIALIGGGVIGIIGKDNGVASSNQNFGQY